MNSNSDHRRHKRFTFETIILHDILVPGMFYEAKLFNVSKGGVYFESDQVLYPGEEIYIALKNGPDSGNHKKYCSYIQIRWRKDLQDSSYQYGYGAAFMNGSDPLLKVLEVVDFLSQHPKNHDLKKEKDPREHQRQPYQNVVYFTSRNQKYKGFIKNISRGGAFIITQEKFAIGQMIKLVFPGSNIKKEVRLKGWIIRVDENGVGVRFDRRSGKDRRSDLDRRRKIIDRRKSQRPRKRNVFRR